MNNYKWLYSKTNFLTKVEFKKLEKFFYSTFDYELGWEPEANTQKKEFFAKKQQGLLRFDDLRRRYDPNYFKKESKYVIFGDSFALSRQVSEFHTIAHQLGNKKNNFIPNYGVGNYGLDQAYLRFLKYKSFLKHKHILFIIVPETIVRINTRWRHFHETGNIFGFKPKFFLNNRNEILLQENPIKDFADYEIIFNEFVQNKSFLINDTMYKIRFREEAINFYNLIKLKRETFSKVIEYFEWIIKRNQLIKISDIEGLTIRMKSNSKFTNKCYSLKETKDLLEKLILEIKDKTRNNMSILVVPQLSDLKINCTSRETFFKSIRDRHNVRIYDSTNYLIKKMGSIKNIDSLYVEKGYGGHLNEKGNKLISDWIEELISCE